MGRALILAAVVWLSAPHPAAGQTPLTCGQTVAGDISAAAEADLFTFEAQVGDVVSLSLVATAVVDEGYTPLAEIYGPTGSLVGSTLGGSAAPAFGPLTAAGTYTIHVRDVLNTRRGSYAMHLQWLAPAARACATGTLTCGQTTTGTLDTVPDQDVFTFEGLAGDVVSLSLLATSVVDEGYTPLAEIYGPTGSLVGNATGGSAAPALGALTAAGTYTVRLRDLFNTRRGSYALHLQWLAPAARVCATGILTCGQTTTGSLDSLPDQNIFTFEAQAGDVVTLTLVATSVVDEGYTPLAEIYGPTGSYVGSFFGGSGFTGGPLPLAGTYTARVRDLLNTRRGSYAMHMRWLAPAARVCATGTLTCGQTTTGSLDTVPDQDVFTFEAQAGDVVSLSLVTTAGVDPGFTPTAEIFGPMGSWVGSTIGGSGAPVFGPLTAAGTYAVRLRDVLNNRRGSYALHPEWLAPAARACAVVALTCGHGIAQSIDAVAAQDVLAFTALSGDVISVSLLATAAIDAGFNPVGEIYGPTGTWVASVYASSNIASLGPLAATGTYSMRLRDTTNARRGSYALQLQWLAPGARVCAPQIACGQTATGALDGAADQGMFTLSAQAADIVSLTLAASTALDPGFDPVGAVFGPTGALIRNTFWGTVQVGPMAAGGTYAVRVHDFASLSRRGAYTLEMHCASSQPGTLRMGIPEAVTVSPQVPVAFDLTVPEGLPHLFLTLQKDTSWIGTLTMTRGETLVATTSGSADHILHVPAPVGGAYRVTVSGSGGGVLTALDALSALTLGEPRVGTIRRTWGSAWYQVDVPAEQSELNFTVETLGLWSRLDVYFGTLAGTARWAGTGDTMTLTIETPAAGRYYLALADSAWVQGGIQTRDHVITANTTPLEPPSCTAPSIAGFTPTTAGTAGPVTVRITGHCLDPEGSVVLERAGHVPIPTTSVIGDADKQTLAATFDTRSAATGDWTLLLTNPSSESAVAPMPLTVTTGGAPNLWVELLGRSQVRADRWQSYTIRFGNNGTVDAYDLILTLQVPQAIDYYFDPPWAVPSWVPVSSPANEGVKTIPIWLLRLAAGGEGSVTFRMRCPVAAFIVGSLVPLNVSLSRAPESLFSRTGSLSLIRTSPTFQSIVDAVLAAATAGGLQPSASQSGAPRPPVSRSDIEQQAEDFVSQTGQEFGRLVVVPPYTGMLVGSIVGALVAPLLGIDPWTGAGLGATFGGMVETALGTFNALVNMYMGAADLISGTTVTIVSSISPEDKYGPSGGDPDGTPPEQRQRWVPASRPIDYRIDFWNKEDAPAATVDVIIQDQLDAHFDWSTFHFTGFGFLDWKVELEPTQYFNVDVHGVRIDLGDYYPGEPVVDLVVNVQGTFDPETGQIEWQFHALDPITREPPDHPLAGFLPPFTASGWEIGWVGFSALPAAGLATGTQVANQSFVKFDVDVFKPAPPGGAFVNTLDADAPVSRVAALAPTQGSARFQVTWSGSDNGSGISTYTIFVSENGSPFRLWLPGTPAMSAVFTGHPDRTYRFFAVASDYAGNVEPSKTAAEAETTAGRADAYHHSCAVTESGGARCWGANYSGQLGDGTAEPRATPVDVSGLTSGVLAVVSGGSHACALTEAGGVKCWGANYSGQLGDGTTTGRATPVDVSGLATGVLSVSAGAEHTCALLSGGVLKCWGSNGDGQLGDGTYTLRPAPVDVVDANDVSAVAAGRYHTCALTSAGGVKCWGANFSGQLGDGTTITRPLPADVSGLTSGVSGVAAGGSHTCAVTTMAGVKCWGLNEQGQLGDGTITSRPTEADVAGLTTGVMTVTAGETHTCALTTSGAVKCWGDNALGQLGDGSKVRRTTPVDVSGLAGGVALLTAIGTHTCAVTSTGGVWCWGFNGEAQLGDGTGTVRSTPVDVLGVEDGVTDVSAGGAHTCVVTPDGGARCWGQNTRGQLGDGTTATRTSAVDVVGLTSGLVQVTAGDEHTCAVTVAGGVKCWGDNYAGQLGDGSTAWRAVPGDVAELAAGVFDLAAGSAHSCAVTSGGGVMCWGRNTAGQLGDGTTAWRTAPVAVAGLTSGVIGVAAGGEHTCALTSAGGVLCWGDNAYGQLGDSTTTDRASPVPVTGLASGVVKVAAGAFHTCAVTDGGDVLCWGSNSYGQLGDATMTNRTTPVEVVGLGGGATNVAAGFLHTCAVTSGGGLECWGANIHGQLGDGSMTNRSTPVDVLELTGAVRQVAAGDSHSCLVTGSGKVKCWGNDRDGQLGAGRPARLVPVAVAGFGSAPTIATIAPATGPVAGDVKVTVTGTHFLAGTVVQVGGRVPNWIRIVSETEMEIVMPRGTPGPADVTVSTSDGTVTLADGYTYLGSGTASHADLRVTKTHLGSFTVGTPGVYTLVVSNVGGGGSTGPIVVIDQLPDGLTYSSWNGDGWSCTAESVYVKCLSAGPLANGATLPPLQITVQVGPAAVPAVTNVARVSSSDDQGNAADKQAADYTVVSFPPPASSHSNRSAAGSSNPKNNPGLILDRPAP